jgi:uncharacterized Tic20 family protein
MNLIAWYMVLGLFVSPLILWIDLKKDSNGEYAKLKTSMNEQGRNTILFLLYIVVAVLWLPLLLWELMFKHLFKDKENNGEYISNTTKS